MAGPKPSKPSIIKTNVYTLALILFLCISSYLFGLWRHGGPTSLLPTSTVVDVACSTTTTTTPNTLDFTAHHAAESKSATSSEAVLKTYPLCNISYSEYTPCQDAKRSLKFSRRRLRYRERHCPAKNELLKCRVPAPYGYKNPFTWPTSRDLVWYANVPHKELTVEKAVQNWIRYESDRFKFPGGGTMFPNGADAYIDDIGKLINLNDGSIRTAVDTGCGVG